MSRTYLRGETTTQTLTLWLDQNKWGHVPCLSFKTMLETILRGRSSLHRSPAASIQNQRYGISVATMKPDQRTEVPDMFRRKNDKRIVELNPEELQLAKYALLGFRNKLVAQGKPTEDVNELLLKIMK